ncbi:uncharacterized protein DUF4199 [Mucilaginibacter frigoritolerans]|uniref:Uncharacterized protein DUF4199 n=1 Tax=Mucilaginibacter frigoritolerans TaxID=652788 RepID=A0A562TRM1_9SPHI|nr:DUF4199 domain-containing protein [Mucilaginibacter frigoritolerans]TWI96229.1 uncharacterized protein DUF4199 [Mucilaginibacter frigoritolerans]
MKKTALRYGGYAALAELLFFVLTWLIIRLTGIGHKAQGNIGWADLLCPLVFVYFGIRYYRDHVNNGSITFLQALKIGLLIVLIPAFAFALIETTYVIYINPKFYETVYTFDIEEYRKTLSPAQFDIKLKELKQQVALSNNPFFNFGMMVLTIMALGTIITIISAILLKRRLKL